MQRKWLSSTDVASKLHACVWAHAATINAPRCSSSPASCNMKSNLTSCASMCCSKQTVCGMHGSRQQGQLCC